MGSFSMNEVAIFPQILKGCFICRKQALTIITSRLPLGVDQQKDSGGLLLP